MKPLISVIVPVYNNEKYLCECLESIIAQTYHNIQIITVDDGSTDASGKILDQYAVKDRRIEVYHIQNSGVSTARNIGLKHVAGEYITFVDSDDALSLDMYDILLDQFMNKNDVDIVHCGYEKKRLDGTSKMILGSNQKYCFDRTEGMLHFIKGDLFTGALWNKIYRRSVLENLYFAENIKINEDILFNFYAFKKARYTVLIDRPLYRYYERNNASTKRTASRKKAFDCAAVAKEMYQESKGEPYEIAVRTRYIRELMNQYRVLIYSGISETAEERKKIEKSLRALLSEENELKKKYVNNYRAMTICPSVYMKFYNIYDKIRKPNWDIGS